MTDLIVDLTMEEYLDSYRLYYDPEKNIVTDECGFIIFNIFAIIDPNKFYWFKAKKTDLSFYDKTGYPVLLFYEDTSYE